MMYTVSDDRKSVVVISGQSVSVFEQFAKLNLSDTGLLVTSVGKQQDQLSQPLTHWPSGGRAG